jgi:hypothetical protein
VKESPPALPEIESKEERPSVLPENESEELIPTPEVDENNDEPEGAPPATTDKTLEETVIPEEETIEEIEENTRIPDFEPEGDLFFTELEQHRYYVERPCPLPMMCTTEYTPGTQWEQREYDKADESIYPDDIRENIDEYREQLIIWPGIIVDNDTRVSVDEVEITFLLEHHYYDWIEDFGS